MSSTSAWDIERDLSQKTQQMLSAEVPSLDPWSAGPFRKPPDLVRDPSSTWPQTLYCPFLGDSSRGLRVPRVLESSMFSPKLCLLKGSVPLQMTTRALQWAGSTLTSSSLSVMVVRDSLTSFYLPGLPYYLFYRFVCSLNCSKSLVK